MLAHPMMICMPHKRITIDKGKKPQCNKGLVSIPLEIAHLVKSISFQIILK